MVLPRKISLLVAAALAAAVSIGACSSSSSSSSSSPATASSSASASSAASAPAATGSATAAAATVTPADISAGLNKVTGETLGGFSPTLNLTSAKHTVDCWYVGRVQAGKALQVGGLTCEK